MKVKKYRKKSGIINAIQWTGCSLKDAKEFVNQLKSNRCVTIRGDGSLLIGEMRVNKNDWVIKGVSGEIYPIKNDTVLKI